MLFAVKRKDQLPRLPRTLTTDFDRHYSRDVERVFARSAARSPEGIHHLMKRKRVDTIHELIPLLPNHERKAKPVERFKRWWLRLHGSTPYEPVVKPALARLKREGRIPSKGDVLIRTQYPMKGGDS